MRKILSGFFEEKNNYQFSFLISAEKNSQLFIRRKSTYESSFLSEKNTQNPSNRRRGMLQDYLKLRVQFLKNPSNRIRSINYIQGYPQSIRLQRRLKEFILSVSRQKT